MVLSCSNCSAPLVVQLRATAICCFRCHAITRVANARSLLLRPIMGLLGGRKKAVLIGINYKNSKYELEACINDAKTMKYLLTNRYNYPESGIILLSEEETDPNKIPTKRNIRKAMAWLVEGVRAGDTLVFHFAGHGFQAKDTTGDEIDKLKEVIYPLDEETNGVIDDDEINDTIVRPIPRGAKLFSIIDACHSGTMLDLPFFCRINKEGGYVWENHRPRSGKRKGTSGGEAILISGCDDNQLSDELPKAMWDLSKGKATGVMTLCLVQAIENGDADTYGNLLNTMRKTIIDLNAKALELVGGVDPDVPEGSAPPPIQEPQLSSNERFDIYKKPFTL